MSNPDPLDYYAQHAEAFFERTVNLDLSGLRSRFLAKLPPRPHILDVGCGSGRDARAFREAGASVVALEPVEQLARMAEAYTGLSVVRARVEDLDCTHRFEGIWACASLLHLTPEALAGAFHRLHHALVPGGILMACFKSVPPPATETRPFTNFTAAELDLFVRRHTGFDILSVEVESATGAEAQRWTTGFFMKPI